MKKPILMRWFWCLLEYLLFSPIILIIAGFSLPEASVIPFVLVLPLHTLSGVALTAVLKKFRKLLTAVIGVVYTAVMTWLWVMLFRIDLVGGTALTAIGIAFLFIYGIRAGTSGGIRRYFFYFIGLLFHCLSVFLAHKAPMLAPFQTFALGLAFLYVLGGLPFANRRFLVQETQEKSSVHILPGTVLRGNRIILIMVMAGIILLSFWRTFLDAIVYAAGKIAAFIWRLVQWLTTLREVENLPQGGGDDMGLPPATPSNNIMDIIAYVFVLIIFLFILIRFFKNLPKIMTGLFSWFSSVFSRFRSWGTAEQGYVDKQESLLKTETPKRSSFLNRLFQREPKWRDMKDNISKVRFLYAQFVLNRVRKGFSFSQSETPGETIDRIQEREKEQNADHNNLRNAYQQARYGNKAADDQTVEMLKDAYL
ncbi:MAG: DUF4129 domain-containing protein [Ruminiclostridium sp.]|nr:DUF4129 domain-containing protein [Ruminiclostridium sp.]